MTRDMLNGRDARHLRSRDTAWSVVNVYGTIGFLLSGRRTHDLVYYLIGPSGFVGIVCDLGIPTTFIHGF